MAAPPIAPPQRFVQEGLFLAIPTGVPGWCAPLPPDECRITNLTHGPRCIYGVTDGPIPHVLAADYRGSVCYVRSMGPVSSVRNLAGVAVTEGERGGDLILVAANTDSGCMLLQTFNHPTDDVIQEPTFWSPPYEPVLPPLDSTAHDVTAAGQVVWVLTGEGVQRGDLKTGRWEAAVTARPGAARCFLYRDKTQAWYADSEGQIWRLEGSDAKKTTLRISTPLQTVGGANTPHAVPIVDAEGMVLLVDLVNGAVRAAGRSPLTRVQTLCTVPDGRIFGLCGDGIGAFFRIDPTTRECLIMGAVVATVGVRRYGFEFSRAIPGQDGEIIWSENDRGGHLWLYYPRSTFTAMPRTP